MASLNQANLIGNVGKDPEVRAINDNQRVAELTLATSRKYKAQDGTVKEETEWHNIVLFGSLADVAAKYVKKGSSIYVGGRIRTRNWKDTEGVTHYRTEIVGETVQLLDKREGGNAGGGNYGGGYAQSPAQGYAQQYAPQGGYAPQQPAYAAPIAPAYAPADDDLPFR